MATVEQRVKDIQSSWEKERNGVVFVKDGLFGMKDTDGDIIHDAEYAFIGRCRDHILFLRPDGSFRKKSPGCVENGYMSENQKLYVKNGKVGFKVDGKVVNASNAIDKKHFRKAEFFLKASLWALEKGNNVNFTFNSRSALDYVKKIQEKPLDAKVEPLVKALDDTLLSHGAKILSEMKAERLANTDYFKELGYLRK